MKNKLILGRLLQLFSVISLVLPLIILLIWKKDVYFVEKDSGLSISIGVVVGVIYFLLLAIGILASVDKLIKPLITISVITIITYLLDSIMFDLLYFLVAITIGYFIFYILQKISAPFILYGKEYNLQKVREQAKNDFQINGRG